MLEDCSNHFHIIIFKTSLDKLDVALLHTWLTNPRRKLFGGVVEFADEESEEHSSENDDDGFEEDIFDM